MSINKSISDLKNIKQIIDICKQNKEPVFLEKNGQNELVIMSHEYFNNLWNLLISFEHEKLNKNSITKQSFHVGSLEELYQKLDEAEIAIQQGRFYTHEEVLSRLHNQSNSFSNQI